MKEKNDRLRGIDLLMRQHVDRAGRKLLPVSLIDVDRSGSHSRSYSCHGLYRSPIVEDSHGVSSADSSSSSILRIDIYELLGIQLAQPGKVVPLRMSSKFSMRSEQNEWILLVKCVRW